MVDKKRPSQFFATTDFARNPLLSRTILLLEQNYFSSTGFARTPALRLKTPQAKSS
jgi:hypothetical protein